MKKYIVLLLVLVGIAQTTYAQKHRYYYKKHEIGGGLQVGVTALYGQLPFQLNSEKKANYGVGIQYDYFVDAQWSIGLGGQYSKQTIEFYGNNVSGQSQEVDWEQDAFRFQYNAKAYRETWNVNTVDIPLTVQYRGTKETDLYVRTGMKYSLVMSNDATSTWSDLKTTGYFPKYDITMEDPIFAGFGTQATVENTHALDLKNRLSWIGEIGVKHSLSEYQNIYVGVYFDLGLNSQSPKIEGEQATQLLAYQAVKGDALKYNTSQHSKSANFKSYSFGIQLRYSVGL